MVLVCSLVCASQWFNNKRTSKPFSSLVGETYELKTNKFKFVGECVSKEPTVLAYHAKGLGFEISKNVEV